MKLTQDEKRAKIAEACGWRGISEQFLVGYAPWRPAPYEQRVRECPADDLASIPLDPLPDYFGCLNAMHEAEKCTALQAMGYSFAYVPNLMAVVRRDSAATCAHLKVPLQPEEILVCCIFATAAQRAEAFGITLGLWKEGE